MYIEVLKRTNKYVYLADGTHMTHSDFSKHTRGLREEERLLDKTDYANSVQKVVVLQEELDTLEEKEYALQSRIDGKAYDWEKSFRDEVKKHDDTKNKLTQHARRLYKDLASLPILNGFVEEKGIKFIIQKRHDSDEYRFCFDPYQLVSNFHSSLSDIYREIGWGTINGGWMRVSEDSVTLYAQSGDYGVFDDVIATMTCQRIFPNHGIRSYAGIAWEKIC